jgi:hypothetical protein
MITYNHAPFVAQAIDSVLMQKTDFPFELVIGEDESTDGTREICIEYARKYPELIRLFLRQRSDPARAGYDAPAMYNALETLNACGGQYIAFLEGDDYWTDPQKLQIQAVYLDEHPEVVACSGRYQILENGATSLAPDGLEAFFKDQPHLVATYHNFNYPYVLRPLTVMFRRAAIPGRFQGDDGLDLTLWAHLLRNGKCGVALNRFFSVYRKHPGGIWSLITKDEQQTFVHQTLLRLASNEGLGSRCIRKAFIMHVHSRLTEARQALNALRSCLTRVLHPYPHLPPPSRTSRLFHRLAFGAQDACLDLARLQLESVAAMHDPACTTRQRLYLWLRHCCWLVAMLPLVSLHLVQALLHRRSRTNAATEQSASDTGVECGPGTLKAQARSEGGSEPKGVMSATTGNK